MKGKFIVIDGVGGSGKTTQVRLLKEKFGRLVMTHEPGGAPRAEKIREVLLRGHSEKPTPLMDFFLFWAARVEHVRERIAPALAKGKYVMSDRFDSATFAFQVFGENRRDLATLFWETRKVVLENAIPDYYILLDLSPEVAEKRRAGREPTTDRFDERDTIFQRRVRTGYKAFAKKMGKRASVVNANRPLGDVHAELVRIVSRILR